MIVCCGEALIDMLPRQMPDGGDSFLPVPGGAVFNTAIALGRLGEDVQFFSGLSTDMFGRRLAAHLEESGVDTTLCKRSPRPTTLAFVTLAGGNAKYTFYDEGTAGRMLDIADLPDLSEEATVLHFWRHQPDPRTLRIGLRRTHAAQSRRSRHFLRSQHPPGLCPRRGRLPQTSPTHGRNERYYQSLRRGFVLARAGPGFRTGRSRLDRQRGQSRRSDPRKGRDARHHKRTGS